MKSYTLDHIKRFRKAHPEMSDKTDVEILYYLKFHRDLKTEINETLAKLNKAIRGERR